MTHTGLSSAGRSLWLLVLSLSLFTMLADFGCGKSSSSANAPPAKPAVPTTLPIGSASITGQIKFLGKPIPPNVISVTDPGCNCQEVTEPGEKIAPDGGLADAIVYLDVPAVGDGAVRPTVTLDQVQCNYVPHVLAVQTRQAVIIKSSDPTMHNVRYQSAHNASRNLTMSTAGETFPTQFSEPEFIHFQCDVHPWMSAWVGVFDHPYFCTTDAAGHFTIDHLPAGNYTLVVWHELLGAQRITVQLADAKQIEQNLTFGLTSSAK